MAIEKEGEAMMWEKLFLAATITLILNLFVSGNYPSAFERNSNPNADRAQVPIALSDKE